MARVASGDGFLYFIGKSALSERLLNGNNSLSRAVRLADQKERIKYDVDVVKLLPGVKNNNDIIIEFEDLFMPETRDFMNTGSNCLNYQIYALKTSSTDWHSIAMAPSVSPAFVKKLNAQIAQRFEFIQYVQSKILKNMTVECQQHFEPLSSPAVTFDQLNIYMISGAFWMLGALLILAVVMFVLEIMLAEKYNRSQTGKIINKFENSLISEEEITARFVRLLRNVESQTEYEKILSFLDH